MTTMTAATAGTWTVEVPTLACFAARNFGVKTVRGTIALTTGTVEIGPDGQPSRLAGTLDPASIDTGNPHRDRDLRGKRFLDVANHPLMDVVASHIEPTAGGWRARAVLRVAGAETPLWIDGALDERSTADHLFVMGTGVPEPTRRGDPGAAAPGRPPGRALHLGPTDPPRRRDLRNLERQSRAVAHAPRCNGPDRKPYRWASDRASFLYLAARQCQRDHVRGCSVRNRLVAGSFSGGAVVRRIGLVAGVAVVLIGASGAVASQTAYGTLAWWGEPERISWCGRVYLPSEEAALTRASVEQRRTSLPGDDRIR